MPYPNHEMYKLQPEVWTMLQNSKDDLWDTEEHLL